MKAIVTLSGGLDSLVVLALAHSQGKECYALTFDYNQRHLVEIEHAKRISKHYGIPHLIIRIDPAALTNSSLTTKSTVPIHRSLQDIVSGGIPSTYVPARNTLFLSYAAAQAEILGAEEIHFGPNAMDFNAYPDCRPRFFEAFQNMLNLATKQSLEHRAPRLVTPLIEMDKKQIIQLGKSLDAPLHLSWSCYNPQKTCVPCLVCDACLLRRQAFED